MIPQNLMAKFDVAMDTQESPTWDRLEALAEWDLQDESEFPRLA